MMKIISLLSALVLGCTGCMSQAKFKSVDNAEFAKVIKDTTVQLVDVRTGEEFAAGHIEGAVNIDVLKDDFNAECKQKLDKNRPVAVYCRSGRRSKNAAAQLAQKGYTVIELDTGYSNWK